MGSNRTARGYNLIQVGSFDVENFGDLLFPIVFEYEIRKRLKLDNLYLFSPRGGVMPFYKRPVYTAERIDEFCAEHDIDGIIIGGGDTIRLDNKILRDYPNSFIPSFSLWQLPLLVGNKYAIPTVFNCPGVPIDFGLQQAVVEDSLELADYVSVRDSNAKSVLADTDNKKIEVVLDSVNLIDEVYPKKSLHGKFMKLKKKNHIQDKFIVIQVNKIQFHDTEFIENLVELVKLINREYHYQVVFSPIGYVHDDLDCLREIWKRSEKQNVIIEAKMTPEEMLALFSHSAGFIGTSLHGLITSNAYRVPILAIDTQGRNKIEGFMRLCGFEKFIVKDITTLSEVFRERFFGLRKYDTFIKERAKLNGHFDEIAAVIRDGKSKHSKMSGGRAIVSMLDNFYQLSQQHTRAIVANFVFSKNSKRTTCSRFIAPSEDGSYVIKNPNAADAVGLTFQNHMTTVIRKIEVTDIHNQEIPYSISHYAFTKADVGEKVYINPNIVLNDIQSKKKIILKIDFDFCEPDEIIRRCSEYEAIINSGFWRRTQLVRKLLARARRS